MSSFVFREVSGHPNHHGSQLSTSCQGQPYHSWYSNNRIWCEMPLFNHPRKRKTNLSHWPFLCNRVNCATCLNVASASCSRFAYAEPHAHCSHTLANLWSRLPVNKDHTHHKVKALFQFLFIKVKGSCGMKMHYFYAKFLMGWWCFGKVSIRTLFIGTSTSVDSDSELWFVSVGWWPSLCKIKDNALAIFHSIKACASCLFNPTLWQSRWITFCSFCKGRTDALNMRKLIA